MVAGVHMCAFLVDVVDDVEDGDFEALEAGLGVGGEGGGVG